MRMIILLCCGIAILAAAAPVFAPQRMDAAIIIAIAMLVCAQIIAILARQAPKELDDAKLANLAQRISKNATELERLSTRTKDQAQKLAELEQKQSRLTVPTATVTTKQLRPQLNVSQYEPATKRTVHEQPKLFLEPIVQVSEGRTVYYKASLQHLGVDGFHLLMSADLQVRPRASHQLDAGQDVELLQRVISVMTKLRARKSASGIFLPISLTTLVNQQFLEAYLEMLGADAQKPPGIVLDINVSVLDKLEETGLQNLAWLASLNVVFCLTGSGAATYDLSVLSELGFRFIDFPSEELFAADGHLRPDAVSKLQSLSERNLTPIIAGLANRSKLSQLMQFASLGRGPAFAFPRPVKTDSQRDFQPQRVA